MTVISVGNKVPGGVVNQLWRDLWRKAGCSGRRRPCAAAEIFFWLLSSDQFSYRIDVWGRLCTHSETAKVMTVASCFTFLNVLVNLVLAFEGLESAFFYLFLKGQGSRNKAWVIITDISQEVENNTITRVNAYARQYVSRQNVAAGGSNAGGGSSGRS
jgi:hypothetical protein